jgi:hypothetical protein
MGNGPPWLAVDAAGRRDALERARTAISGWLDVPPDSFDLEIAE